MKTNGGSNKKRHARTLTIEVSKKSLRKSFTAALSSGKTWGHLILCLLAAAIMWGITFGWMPPFSYRIGMIPQRDIVAAIAFQVEDPVETETRQRRAVAEAVCVFDHDPRAVTDQLQLLQQSIAAVGRSASFEDLDQAVWRSLYHDLVQTEQSEETQGDTETDAGMDTDDAGSDGSTVVTMSEQEEQQAYEQLKLLLSSEQGQRSFDAVLALIFEPWIANGVLLELEHGIDEGSQQMVQVLTQAQTGEPPNVELHSVAALHRDSILAGLSGHISKALETGMFAQADMPAVQTMLLTWIRGNGIPVTLTYNAPISNQQRESQRSQVATQFKRYHPGQMLAPATQSLGVGDIQLLRQEYDQIVSGRSARYEQALGYGLANFGMYLALFTLCGVYLAVYEVSLVNHTKSLVRLLVLVIIVVLLATATSNDTWRAELIPLVMFTMVMTICYRRDSALLLSSTVALIVAVATGSTLAEYIIVISAITSTALLLGRLRSRLRLIVIGFGGGVITLATTLGVSILAGQTFGSTGLDFWDQLLDSSAVEANYITNLFQGAAWYGFCVCLAGFFMTGLLPIIEWAFGVQTDISLMELGDPAHPLLTELQRRAPGTFMHSLNVATLSEPAAEAIGANGLLCRVGAYFHDIGKMIKPEYFAENQVGDAGNRHESLLPSMSRLVIISHVKDGADLGRKHRLPESIVDFIMQHHGTTLVEYFYHQAKTSENGAAEEVDEADYRYDGPRPQTREAAVMMLADAVESACRSLDDPAPARIEHLVRELAMKRLLDGQFDECGLTLRELNIIQTSLIKTETALLHNRVKYPDQATA
jgi:putative nucleotidyltransferase with HDIG domain